MGLPSRHLPTAARVALAFSLALFCVVATVSPAAEAASTGISARGKFGQRLTAVVAKQLSDGQKVRVYGAGYNTRVGIYATFCVVPPKGQRPDLCGPFDITGKNNASVWISSHPPLYAALLVTRFSPGGRFSVTLTATRHIGSYDCKKVRCAFVTRADHTLGSNRTADVFIPVTFK